MANSEYVGLRVSPAAKEALEVIAKQDGRATADVIRSAINHYLQSNGFPVSAEIKRGRPHKTKESAE